jgi:hypothetical protein
MLGTILPYDSEPIRVSQQTPVACEVWFVDDAADQPPATTPPYLLADLLRPNASNLVH